MSTVTSANEFCRRSSRSVCLKSWHQVIVVAVVGNLGGFENKLRNSQTYWGVPPMKDASGGAESVKLTIPKYVMGRAGANAGDYVCAKCTLRVSKPFRPSAFDVYLAVTELRLLNAPATPERTPPRSIQRAGVEVGCCESQLIPRTKPTIAVIHSRSQEAQVYADLCQPVARARRHGIFATDSGQHAVRPELMHTIRTANTYILALIRRRK